MSNKSNQENNELSYAQLHDIPQLSIKEAQEQLLLTTKYNQQRGCLVFVGEAGLGKTQIVNQTAAKIGYKVIPIRTAQWGPLGCGIPSREEASAFFKLIVPDIFPKEGEKSILLFDEINRGQAHAINMFFNLIEDREMFDYKLPKNCVVVATMNPSTNNYNVTPIEKEAALRRRLKFMYINTSINAFIKHAKTKAFHQYSGTKVAKNKSCHPQILDFYRASPDNIYDRKALEELKQFSCPATIETISEDSYILDAEKIKLTSVAALSRFAGSIGLNMAHALVAFIKNNATTINVTEVIHKYPKVAKKVKKLTKDGLHEHLAELSRNVSVMVFAEKPKASKVAENLIKFWTDLPKEIASSVFNQLKSTADEANAGNYLNDLMNEFGIYDSWIDLHRDLENQHKNIDRAIAEND